MATEKKCPVNARFAPEVYIVMKEIVDAPGSGYRSLSDFVRKATFKELERIRRGLHTLEDDMVDLLTDDDFLKILLRQMSERYPGLKEYISDIFNRIDETNVKK